ncbi:Methyltransferase domain-containing protein [Octadecabacter temperatus]|uniref:dTDP-3-amino-3,6-dideoxy-alpha-D-glucopyranose N,N-dimethyltransferase n=1 Tax=Octadecabacter temperatus TaxID=1458307 RepID=A0A0K0Y2S6_9RHOB|nr:class I SAM-dependent methyltransferase [Octadecabacter temperatus]AKS45239.1 dTDP-3-amino-3,6-dideoxy-alpha-D-glucopyranose N,N-dimethyltransferase [Octadecabacter temperatus]SIN88935.1 Methyltransferase domain-containing protein [Octadecabacter temperatus]
MTHDGIFDTKVAATYDQDHGGTDTALVRKTVTCLEALAGDGPVLEFAIGTGRIALPLAARGIEVHGIELSGAMVDVMRKKETGNPLPVAIGDMTTTQIGGQFSLVALVFNTLDNLTTQAQQVACFQNAAHHLLDGGLFVVETLVPPLQRLPFGETKLVFACDETHFGVDEFDIVTQTYASHHVWMDGENHEHVTVPFRYAWPSEMDLMAQLAGMTLQHRWANWDQDPFDRTCRSHISVWKKS